MAVTKVFNMTGPTGATGDTGAQGAPGPPTISADACNVATQGTDTQLYVPAALPIATTSCRGLVRKVSGLTTDFVDGTNNCQDMVSAVKPTIRSVRLNSVNVIGNPNFECRNRRSGSINPVTAGWLMDRWYFEKNIATGVTSYTEVNFTGATIYPGANYGLTRGAIRISCTTAQASIAAGEYCMLSQWIDGLAFRPISSGPHSVSLVMFNGGVSSLNLSLRLTNTNYTYSYTQLFTLPPSATTLVKMPNLPAFPSAGSFSTAMGANAYHLAIALASGSTYIAPADKVWSSANYVASPGQSNFFSSIANYVEFYFVQHEPGPDCSYAIDCPFIDNLKNCQRFYSKNAPYGVASPTNGYWTKVGDWTSTTTVRLNIIFPIEMAKVPTVNFYGYDGTPNQCYLELINANQSVTGLGNITTRGVGAMNIATTTGSPAQVFGQWNADTGW